MRARRGKASSPASRLGEKERRVRPLVPGLLARRRSQCICIHVYRCVLIAYRLMSELAGFFCVYSVTRIPLFFYSTTTTYGPDCILLLCYCESSQVHSPVPFCYSDPSTLTVLIYLKYLYSIQYEYFAFYFDVPFLLVYFTISLHTHNTT